jgi:hypothetical protein
MATKTTHYRLATVTSDGTERRGARFSDIKEACVAVGVLKDYIAACGADEDIAEVKLVRVMTTRDMGIGE